MKTATAMFTSAALLLASAAAQAQIAALTDDEVMLIGMAVSLTRTGGTEKAAVLPSETSNLGCEGRAPVTLGGCPGAMRTAKVQPDDVLAWLSRQFPDASPEVIADFREKAQNSAIVSRPLPINIMQTIGEQGATDPALQPAFVLDFSRVGFNPAKTEAIVYIAGVSQNEPKRSYGEYLYLRNDAGTWKVAARARNWSFQ